MCAKGQSLIDVLLYNQINLGLQMIIILLFISAIVLKTRGRTLMHGRIMTLAFGLNAISLLALMTPLLLKGYPIVTAYTDTYAIIFLVHHILGLVAFVLSLFLVARFALGRFTLQRCKGKWLMRTTAVTWGAVLVMGVFLYASGYFPG